MTMLEVLKPGPLSSFQDLGRFGLQALGVPACGAMDPLAHRLANLIVGNAENEATLEFTIAGPTLRFGRAAVVALAGCELDACLHLDGRATPVPGLRATRVPASAELRIGARRSGARGYLAIAGGFGLAPVMGSRSTCLRGGFGGHEGRALRAGDRLPLPLDDGQAEARADRPPGPLAGLLLHALLARGGSASADTAAVPLRIVDGPEWTDFTEASRAALLAGRYRVGPLSDRMGYRLEGPALAQRTPRERLSEAVTFGLVQVPPDGQPIVLMADRQTTGGYPRLAEVIAVDLPLLAQRLPGDPVRFERIGLDAAQALARRRARALADLRRALRP